jgi:hypothetical protein
MSEVLKDKIAIGTGAAGTMGLATTRSLLEALAGFITGEIIDLNGGLLMD